MRWTSWELFLREPSGAQSRSRGPSLKKQVPGVIRRQQGLALCAGAALLVAGALVPQAMTASAAIKKPNVAPSVHITSPGSTDPFIAPALVTVTAEASDSDGTIKSVKFFADG